MRTGHTDVCSCSRCRDDYAFVASLRLKAGFASELTQEIDPNLPLA
jgi:hypothetical protein